MDPAGLRRRAMAVFALHAVVLGGFFSRIPEVQRRLGLDEQEFGLVLTGAPLGVLAGTFLVSALIQRLGTRRLMLAAFPLYGLMPLLAGLSGSAAQLYAALTGYGLFLSFANIAMNVEADRVALASGRPMLLKGHACWSISFLVTTSAAALAIRLGVTPLAQFGAVLLGSWAATALVLLPLQESPPRSHARTGRAPPFALPDRTSFAVLAFALSGIVLEGITRNWAIIYLRDVFQTSDWVAALALPALFATQTLGRLMGDRWVARIGAGGLGRVLSAVSAAGLLAMALGGSTALALAGCLLVGLGISITHPMATAAVARSQARPAAESVAAFASLQTLASFLAPTLFGLIAGTAGLRLALLVLLPLPVLAWAFARVLDPPPP